MSRPTIVAAVLVFAASFASFGVANADTCASFTSSGASNDAFGTVSQPRIATNFTVSSTCWIESATIKLHDSSGSDNLLIDIYDDSAGPLNVIATSDELHTSVGDNTFVFSSSYDLEPGNTYHIGVRRTGTLSGTSEYTWNANSHTGSQLWHYNGSTWSSLNNYSYYFSIEGTSTAPSFVQENSILSIEPVSGTTTASTTISVVVSYYASTTGSFVADAVGYTLYSLDRGYVQQSAATTTAITGSIQDYTWNLVVPSGAYSLQAFLKSGDSFIAFSDSDTSGANNIGVSEFNVVADPWPNQLGTTTDALWSLATSTCSITNITGCFQNAIVWAFYPTQSVMDALAGVGSLVMTKPPFGYFAVYKNSLEGLAASTTLAFEIEEYQPAMDNVFTPIRDGLIWLMFVIFGIYVINRLRNLDL